MKLISSPSPQNPSRVGSHASQMLVTVHLIVGSVAAKSGFIKISRYEFT